MLLTLVEDIAAPPKMGPAAFGPIWIIHYVLASNESTGLRILKTYWTPILSKALAVQI